MWYAGVMLGDKFRVIIAALCLALACGFFLADPGWRTENLLMGLAALVSIAALLVPTIRERFAPAHARKVAHRGARR